MKIIDRIKRQGISLKKFNIVMFLAALVISAVIFVAMKTTTDYYEETNLINESAGELRNSAYEMQEASDYLTEQIRGFAITGEKKYLDNYFTEANVTKRREKALETIKRYQGNTAAFKSLNEAMVGSVQLMDTEYYAARLTLSAYGLSDDQFPDLPGSVELSAADEALSPDSKKALAQKMLFDEAYRSKKEYISNNMRSCLDEISESVGKEQQELSTRLTNQVYLEHLLTVFLVIIMFFMVTATSILVINPMMKMVGLIREGKPIPIRGAYEVKFLARTYNLIYYTNIERNKKLEYEASHDKLTGLYNRRGYDFLIENIDIETSGLVLIDVDRFKEINDAHGHDIGDRALVRVADALLKSFKSYGYVCRTGGDEFVVILIRAGKSTKSMVEKKIKKLNEKLSKSSKNIPAVTISAGVSFGKAGMDIDDLFKASDEALYNVKEHGRADVEFAG